MSTTTIEAITLTIGTVLTDSRLGIFTVTEIGEWEALEASGEIEMCATIGTDSGFGMFVQGTDLLTVVTR